MLKIDGVSVKLRRGVAVHRPGSVVLERGRNELARRLRRVNIADARLRVPLQFAKCDANAFAVRLPHALIATDKGGERNRLRRGERGIPSGPMLDAGDFLAVFVLVGSGGLVLDELRADSPDADLRLVERSAPL